MNNKKNSLFDKISHFRKKFTGNKFYLSIFIVIVIATVFVLFAKKNDQKETLKDELSSNEKTLWGKKYKKTKEYIEKYSIPGQIVSDNSFKVVSEIPGRVSNVFFKNNNEIKKNDIIIEIEDDKRTENQIRLLRERLDIKNKNYLVNKELYREGLISRNELRINLIELNKMKDSLNELIAFLGKHFLHAPISGIIYLGNIIKGTEVVPNEPLGVIYENRFKVVAFVSTYEKDILEKNKDIVVSFNDGRKIRTRIARINRMREPRSNKIKIESELIDYDGKLLINEDVRVFFNKKTPKTLKINEVFLVEENDKIGVYLLNKSKTGIFFNPVKIVNKEDSNQVIITNIPPQGFIIHPISIFFGKNKSFDKIRSLKK